MRRAVTRNEEAYARQFLHGAEQRLARAREALNEGRYRSAAEDAVLVGSYARHAAYVLKKAHEEAQEAFSRVDS